MNMEKLVGNSYKIFHPIRSGKLLIPAGKNILVRGVIDDNESYVLEYIDECSCSHVFIENVEDFVIACTEYQDIDVDEKYQVIIEMKVAPYHHTLPNMEVSARACVLSGEDLLQLLKLKDSLIKYKGFWSNNDTSSCADAFYNTDLHKEMFENPEEHNTSCTDLYEKSSSKGFEILYNLILDDCYNDNVKITSIKWFPELDVSSVKIVSE